MSEEGDLPTKLGEVIPSLYYDLIARVCAGVPFLALLMWNQREQFAPFAKSPTIAFLLLLGAGYLAGLLLSPFSAVWSFPLLPLFRQQFGLKESSFLPLRDSKKSSATTTIAIRNDLVSAADSVAGSTLAKMQAETTLCQNLVTAFVLLFFADSFGLIDVAAINTANKPLLIFVFFALWIAALFRLAAYLYRQNRLYKIFVEGEKSLPAQVACDAPDKGGMMMDVVTESPKHKPSELPQGYRQGVVTAITVFLGFSLSFMRFWGIENPGQWTLSGIFSASILGVGILIELIALFRSLEIRDDNPSRYATTVRLFFVGVAVVVLGVFISMIVAA